jgi:predicted dehydrogenase
MNKSRRKFVQNTVKGALAVSIGGVFSAKSYGRIIGANDKVRVAAMGVNSRGLALGSNFAKQPNCDMVYSCDVDSRAAEKFSKAVEGIQKSRPKIVTDFRKALEDKNVDALMIAAPDHWHAPAALLGMKAGKHVYLEKPCSHNPHEGELLIASVKKYGLSMQMGNQRRSWPNVIEAINELKAGVIGKPYFAKAWYTNNRASIGRGKEAAVPAWLNYDLWQGPAPREKFRDNILHYNWHWFWNWGTGEALNNGTHMVDLARWGLGVDYPIRVNSSGGRYRFDDDWQTPDTQVINLEFSNNTFISWEGRSCNGMHVEDSSTGVVFYGENGSLMIDGGNSYTIYDLKSKVIKEVKNDIEIDARNNMNPSEQLDALHINNFFDNIKKGTALRSDIVSGHQSTLLVQLGNIALRTGRTLQTDKTNGHILHDAEAMKLWRRIYEPGWEPVV